MKRLGIIGGGAAGLACAVEAAQLLRARGVAADVVVLEADERVGRSILATGNGRCNFSNSNIDPRLYHNADFVAEAFEALEVLESPSANMTGNDPNAFADPVHAFFDLLGLVWREEEGGRQYPLANKASVVVDVLRAAAARAGVVEACGNAVVAIEPPRAPGKPYTLRMADGAFDRFDAVVVAVGGRAAQTIATKSAQAGIAQFERFNALQPVLGPLAVDSPYPRALDNIRVRASVTLVREASTNREKIACERGEVMFRKYGVSGIAVFNLSRFAQAGDTLLINFLGGSDARLTGEAALEATPETARTLLARRADRLAAELRGGNRPTCEDVLRGLVLARVADVICKQAGVSAQDAATPQAIEALTHALVAFPLRVTGIADADMCQVRRGGVDPAVIDARTCGMQGAPGLFAVGEAVDVDGPCGGYNLHWAWSSGLLAACAAALFLAEIEAETDGEGR